MKIIELLNKIANDGKIPERIKYNNYEYRYHDKEHGYCRNGYDCTYICLDSEYYLFDILTDEVEILEEEKELHANDIEFNINNDKRDCIITLDENDLGIDKLHLDNCYFYKENDKWYVKKYDFKNFNLEEKKIPEKITINDNGTLGFPNGNWTARNMDKAFAMKINSIIDYLKSKGDE